jgi:hypothetical protein
MTTGSKISTQLSSTLKVEYMGGRSEIDFFFRMHANHFPFELCGFLLFWFSRFVGLQMLSRSLVTLFMGKRMKTDVFSIACTRLCSMQAGLNHLNECSDTYCLDSKATCKGLYWIDEEKEEICAFEDCKNKGGIRITCSEAMARTNRQTVASPPVEEHVSLSDFFGINSRNDRKGKRVEKKFRIDEGMNTVHDHPVERNDDGKKEETLMSIPVTGVDSSKMHRMIEIIGGGTSGGFQKWTYQKPPTLADCIKSVDGRIELENNDPVQFSIIPGQEKKIMLSTSGKITALLTPYTPFVGNGKAVASALNGMSGMAVQIYKPQNLSPVCDKHITLEDNYSAIGKIPRACLGIYAKKALRIIESLHSRGLIHGNLAQEGLVYSSENGLRLANFGHAKFFVDPDTHAHVSVDLCKSTKRGNIETKTGCRSRLVDLDSLGTILNGFVPSNRIIALYMEHIEELGYTERPNYDELRSLFNEIDGTDCTLSL